MANSPNLIAKGLEFKNREILLQSYRVLVRPQQEYCAQFWSPYLKCLEVNVGVISHRVTT